MHFEYICDAVSHGLMKLQMDTGENHCRLSIVSEI